MMHKNESVIGVIFSTDRTKVLLIQRRDVPVWVLPGGGIEPSESPEAAMLREMEEETGYKVSITRKVGIYTPINKLAKLTHLYECAIVSGKPTLSSETKDIRFYSLKSLPKLLPSPYGEWIADSHTIQPLIHRELTSVNYKTLLKHTLFHPILIFRFLCAKIGLTINL